MSITPPPTQQAISDKDGNLGLQWGIFFNSLFNGDAGEAWVPTFVNLLANGAPISIGRVYRISQYLCLFTARVEPANDITANAGVTYIDNFPLQMAGDGVCFAVSGNLGGLPGMCNADNNRIYIPPLQGVTIPVTIVGIVEIQGAQ